MTLPHSWKETLMSSKSHTFGRVTFAALAIAAGLGLAACSGPSTGPSAVEPDDAATSAVVLSETLEDVEPGGQRMVNFSLPRRGTLALTVRWNDQLNSVVATLAGTGCFNIQNPTADCQVRRTIERQGREGREGFINDPNAGGTYQLAIENEGPGTESIRGHRGADRPSWLRRRPLPIPPARPIAHARRREGPGSRKPRRIARPGLSECR